MRVNYTLEKLVQILTFLGHNWLLKKYTERIHYELIGSALYVFSCKI
jgi:hypothetical protein